MRSTWTDTTGANASAWPSPSCRTTPGRSSPRASAPRSASGPPSPEPTSPRSRRGGGEAEPPDRDRDRRGRSARELDDELRFEPEERNAPAWRASSPCSAWLAVIVALILVLSSGATMTTTPDEPGERLATGPERWPRQPNGNSQKMTHSRAGRARARSRSPTRAQPIVVRGLPKPDGSYQVWLYNDIVDAQSLGTITGGSGKLEVKLPPDASDYKSLDVSKEPADANPNHSGASVLRAPLAELLDND